MAWSSGHLQIACGNGISSTQIHHHTGCRCSEARSRGFSSNVSASRHASFDGSSRKSLSSPLRSSARKSRTR